MLIVQQSKLSFRKKNIFIHLEKTLVRVTTLEKNQK